MKLKKFLAASTAALLALSSVAASSISVMAADASASGSQTPAATVDKHEIYKFDTSNVGVIADWSTSIPVVKDNFTTAAAGQNLVVTCEPISGAAYSQVKLMDSDYVVLDGTPGTGDSAGVYAITDSTKTATLELSSTAATALQGKGLRLGGFGVTIKTVKLGDTTVYDSSAENGIETNWTKYSISAANLEEWGVTAENIAQCAIEVKFGKAPTAGLVCANSKKADGTDFEKSFLYGDNLKDTTYTGSFSGIANTWMGEGIEPYDCTADAIANGITIGINDAYLSEIVFTCPAKSAENPKPGDENALKMTIDDKKGIEIPVTVAKDGSKSAQLDLDLTLPANVKTYADIKNKVLSLDGFEIKTVSSDTITKDKIATLWYIKLGDSWEWNAHDDATKPWTIADLVAKNSTDTESRAAVDTDKVMSIGVQFRIDDKSLLADLKDGDKIVINAPTGDTPGDDTPGGVDGDTFKGSTTVTITPGENGWGWGQNDYSNVSDIVGSLDISKCTIVFKGCSEVGYTSKKTGKYRKVTNENGECKVYGSDVTLKEDGTLDAFVIGISSQSKSVDVTWVATQDGSPEPEPLPEGVLWRGNLYLNWSKSVSIDAANLENVAAGDSLVLEISGISGDTAIKILDGGWTGLLPGLVNIVDQYDCVRPSSNTYTYTLTAEDVEVIKSKGLIVTGDQFTLKEVKIEKKGGNTPGGDNPGTPSDPSTPSEPSTPSTPEEKPVEFEDGKNNTDIKVEAPKGAFDNASDVSFNAAPVADETKDGKYTFDLTFTDKDGKEIQPKTAVTVKIPVPEALKDKTVFVYHIDNDGKYTEISCKIEGGMVVFSASSFSKYVVSETKLNANGEPVTTDDSNNSGDSGNSDNSGNSGNSGDSNNPGGNPDTGIAALSLLPIAVAAAGIVVFKKRK